MDSFLQEYVLFGAGLNAYGVEKYLGSRKLIGVIDSNVKRINKDFEGRKILSLDSFLASQKKIPIVISAYQKSTEVEKILTSKYDNYLVSPYLQSSVTEIKDIAKIVLDKANGRNIVFDNSINILVSLLLDELAYQGVMDKVLGFIKGDNPNVLTHYNMRIVTKDILDNSYLVKTDITLNDEIIYDEHSINICNLMYYNPTYKNESLTKYRNIHVGERCFVIGNGPSLRIEDLELLKKNKEICFGCNGIYLAFDKTEWRPDYYVITDYKRYKENSKYVNKIPSEKVFARKFYNMNGVNYRSKTNIYNSPPQRGVYRFSDDISVAIYSGQTVTYNMLQIAAYMGFSEIYLLGVDFSFNTLKTKGTNHFDKRYEESSPMADIFYREENLAAYKVAEEFSRKHGFRIYNATRGGELEVFERVNFDKLF